MRLAFVVPGKPVSWNRAHAGGARAFTTTRLMRDYQAVVASCGLRARKRAGWTTTTKPVAITLRVFFANPRADLDGPLKAILDALQLTRGERWGAGIVEDDHQVLDVRLVKGLDKARPRVEVEVELLEEVAGG